MSSVGYATLQVIPSVRGIDRNITGQLNNQAGAAGAQAGKAYGDNFDKQSRSGINRAGSLLGSLAKGASIVGATALAAAGGLGGFGIKTAAQLEQTQVAFTSLLGSSKAAQDQIKSLQAFAAKTPFEQQDVFNYAQQYFALAGSVGLAKDQVQPFLTAIGDVAAVTGASTENIHNAVLAIGQIGSAGKVTQDNLRQISEAFPGFNANAAIASATGKSTAEVMKEIQAGTLDAKTGVQALIQGMQKFPGAAGAMQKQSETLNGLFSTFTDTIKITLTQAFGPLIPVVKSTLAQLTPVIGSTLQQVAPAIAQFAKNFAPLLGPLIKGIGQILTSVVDTLGPVFKALAPTIKPIAKIVAELFAAFQPLLVLFAKLAAKILPKLMPFFDALADLIGTVGEDLADALEPVLPVIVQSIGDLAGMFKQLLPVIGPVINALVTAFAPVLPIIAVAIVNVVKALQPLITALAGAFVQVLQALAPQMPQLATALGQLAVAMAQILIALVPLIPPLTQLAVKLAEIGGPTLVVLTEALTKLAQLLAGSITVTINGTKDAVNGLKDAFKTLGDVFSTVYTNVIAPVIGNFLDAVDNLYHNVIQPIGDAIKKTWQAIGAVFKSVYDTVIAPVLNVIKTAVQTILDGLKQIFDMLDKLNPLGGGNPGPPGSTDDKLRYYANLLNPKGHKAVGTNFWAGGPVELGEKGVELVTGPQVRNLPRGSKVYDNGTTMGLGRSVSVVQNNYYSTAVMNPLTTPQQLRRSATRLDR